MSALDDSLGKLFEFLEEWGPPVRDVRLIEVSRTIATDDHGRLIISRTALQEPSGYTSRFEDLTHSGLPWLNMSCYGVYNNLLIVGIELPDRALDANSLVPTSVNYSGPEARVIQGGWDASVMLVIV